MEQQDDQSFDPYLRWLGIRHTDRPVNYYRLLGIDLNESDPDVIATAADRQMSHVRRYQAGSYAKQSQELLNELASARLILLDAERRAEYDRLNRLVSPADALEFHGHRAALIAAVSVFSAFVVMTTITVLKSQDGAITARSGEKNEIYSAPVVVQSPLPLGNAGPPSSDTTPQHSISPKSPQEPIPQEGSGPDPNDGATGESTVENESTKTELNKANVPKPRPEFKVLKIAVDPVRFPSDETVWADIKLAISERDVEGASRELVEARSVVRSSSEEEMFAVLSEILENYKQFWLAVEQAFEGAVTPGTLLTYGDLPPVKVEVINKRQIVLSNATGAQVEYPATSGLPPIIAASLAEFVLPKTSDSHAVLGSFWSFDQNGNSEFAQLHWRYLHDDDRLARFSKTWQSTVKLEMTRDPFVTPSPTKMKNLTRTIERRLEIDHAAPKPNSPDRLIAEADRQSKGSLPRYVCLSRALDYATNSGRANLAFAALHRLETEFHVESSDRIRWLNKLVRSADDGSVVAIAKYAISCSVRAIDSDSYLEASTLARIAMRGSKRSENASLVAQASDLDSRAIVLRRAYLDTARARKVLAKSPEQLKSNRLLGEFFCLKKGDFESGLVLLAKSDSTYSELARLSIQAATLADRLNVADRWWEASMEMRKFEQEAVRRQVATLYRGLIGSLHGTERRRVISRLNLLGSESRKP